MSEWKEISPTEYRLVVNKCYVGNLYRLPYQPYNWMVTYRGRHVQEIPKASIDTLKWKATNAVYNFCNQEIADSMKIRDNLPNLMNLAEKAGLFDDMD